ncbi:hypothetical protein EG240_03230 [Paenimyroides tangerinum]|uniref:Uncharacterized protein n=1 Tax=Paenimyroides tangerinum TaxID=2488728 RepID=A0A3P3WFQ6_9FLAO|nr:hypothetical protein [Paenimyroides tangerinum]RRJ92429.1 hypothetical protein EG240_03230 [Paenimyroides tangerinum]
MNKIYLTLLFFVIALRVQAQVGYGTATPDKSAAIEIQASDKGILVPRINLTSATQKLNATANNANALLVFNTGTVLSQGFYYWKAKIENDIDNGSWIALGSEVSSMPKFFYMPSVVLPTVSTDSRITANGNYRYADATFSVNLYVLFSSQFTTPVTSSTGSTGLDGFVFSDATLYEYFITFADSDVFTNVAVTNSGLLTYKVNTNSIIRNGSFMNIVLKVKN